MVTSTGDGMNLVSYEYVAYQKERHGVLTRSELTGPAKSLHSSIDIDLRTAEELANSIYEAVTMKDEPTEQSFGKMLDYIGGRMEQGLWVCTVSEPIRSLPAGLTDSHR